jgi:hypothetical protein
MSRLTICLAGVCIALIVVGLVSNTLARHVIQIVPVVMVLAAALTKREWVVFAALPLFIFWLLIMLFIWLYLLKIATITRGHFTIPEILLTVVIGICCVYGIILSLARLSISRLANIAFIVWHMVIGFILIFFFNTLSHALPSYRRNLQLFLALLIGLGVTLLMYFLQRSPLVFKSRNILIVLVMMTLQAGALTISYL